MTPARPPMAGIVLAAGASTRTGSPKALAELEGQTFVSRVVRSLGAAGCAPLMVVLGPPHEAAIRAAMASAVGVTWLQNVDPARGMLSSLQVAIDALVRLEPVVDGAVVALVDHPRVTAATVSALVAAFTRSGSEVVRPMVWVGEPPVARRGHPYLVSRALFPAILAADLVQGARPVLRAARRHEDVLVEDDAIIDDLDTPFDIARVDAVLSPEKPVGYASGRPSRADPRSR